MPLARPSIAALVLATLSAHASAGVDECAPYAAWLDRSRPCQCGSALLPAYPLDASGDAGLPAGAPLPLVAACGYTQTSYGFVGAFLFHGDVRVTGTLRISDNESLGELVEFEVATPATGTLPSLLRSVRLDEKKARSRVRLPRLSAQSGCWVAPARMNLQTVALEAGPGTGNDGAYALRYAKLSAGKFSRCAQ